LKLPKFSIVKDACGIGKSGASGEKDDEAKWIVAQIGQKLSASFLGYCVGVCCDEGALDVVTLAMTEAYASLSR
jgi:hypothetical protein